MIKRNSVAHYLNRAWILIESFSSAHSIALHLHHVAYTAIKSELLQLRNI